MTARVPPFFAPDAALPHVPMNERDSYNRRVNNLK